MVIRWITLCLIVFFCAIGIVSVNFNNSAQVWNITTTALDNAYLNSSRSFQIDPTANTMEGITLNIIKKVIDVSIYVTIELCKVVGRFAIDNPQINFKLIINLVLWGLILLIVYPLIRIGILIYVFVYDIIQNVKYKKKMRLLREKQ